MINASGRKTILESGKRLVRGVFGRSLFLIMATLTLFAGAVIGGDAVSKFLASSGPVKAVIDVVRLDLHPEADGPTSLVTIAPLSIDDERGDIMAAPLLGQALDEVRPDLTTDDAERADLLQGIDENLRVEAGGRNNEIVIAMRGHTAGAAETTADLVNQIAKAYVDLRNDERRGQKEQALAWADHRVAAWREAIDRLNAQAAVKVARLAEEDQQPETASRTDHQKLLDLLLDANKTAQADTLSKIRTTISVADDIGQNRVDALELHYAELAKDIGRLEGLATQLTEQAPPLRPENASELRDTENQLAQFKQDLDALISSGVLELPAAAMVSQAAAPRSDGLIHRWAVIVPLAAALSVLLAMILASLLSRYRRRRQPNAAERSAGETIPRVKEAVADNKVSSVLTDPYWPMSPKQRLENLQEDAT